jgi:hypothetical protein
MPGKTVQVKTEENDLYKLNKHKLLYEFASHHSG